MALMSNGEEKKLVARGAVKLLRSARDFLKANPDKWCKDHYAVDLSGKSTAPTAATAHKFCMLGAMYKFSSQPSLYRTRAIEVITDVVNTSPAFFNDDPKTTLDDVISAYDKAITQEEKFFS